MYETLSRGLSFAGLPSMRNTRDPTSGFSTTLFTRTASVTSTATKTTTATTTITSTAMSDIGITRTVLATITPTSYLTKTFTVTASPSLPASNRTHVNTMLANMHPAASALLSQFSKPSLNDLVPILEVLLCTAAVSSLGWGGWQLWRKFGRRSRQDPRQVPSAEEAKIWKRNEKISIFLLQKQVDSNPDLREALHKAGIPITIHTLSEDPTASTPRTPASLGMVERAELDAWRNATPADRETMKNHWARQNGDRALDPDNLSSFQKAVLIGEDAGPNDNDTDGNVPRPSTVPSEENDTIIESIENRAVQSAHDIATALAKDESSVRRIRRAFELHHSNGTGPSRVAGQKRRSLEAIDEEEEESPRSRGVETPTPKGNAEEMDIDDEAEEDLVTTSQANRMDPAWRAENLTGTRSTRSAGRTTVSKLNLGSIPKLTAKDRTDTKIPVKRASQEPEASSSSSSTGLGNIPKLDPKRTTTNSRPAKRARTSQEPHDSIADMNKAHSPTRGSRSASARKTSVAPTPSRRSSRLASKEVGNMNLTQMSRRSASYSPVKSGSQEPRSQN